VLLLLALKPFFVFFSRVISPKKAGKGKTFSKQNISSQVNRYGQLNPPAAREAVLECLQQEAPVVNWNVIIDDNYRTVITSKGATAASFPSLS